MYRASLLLLTAVLAISSLPAQRPVAWVEAKVPNGVLTANFSQLGKLVVYRQQTNISVFSAFRRDWKSLSITQNATTRQTNGWLLVQDGGRWTAYSGFRGRFETIQVGASATVLNPVSNRNDSILLVLDGNDLYAFSAFTGTWVKRRVSPGARFAVQRQTAVAVDGTTVLGMSASTGKWVSSSISGQVLAVDAETSTASVETATTIYAFSSPKRSWTSVARPNSPKRSALGDVVVWASGATTLAFSGLRAKFATAATGPATKVTVDRELAVVESSRGMYFYSAAHGTWTRLVPGSNSLLRTAGAMALVTDDNATHAYSALRAAISTQSIVAANADVTTCVAAVVPKSGRLRLYSAITGAWQLAPSGTANIVPALARQAALVKSGSTWSAFSARSGRFVPRQVSASAQEFVDSKSSLVAIVEADKLHVFDPRRETWLDVATKSRVKIRLWRTTLVAHDDNRAFGYGSQAGEIESIALPGSVTSINASSECARISTAKSILAYSAVPDLTSMAQFPEFRRIATYGAAHGMQLRGEARAAVVLAMAGTAKNAIRIPVWGTLFLSPQSLIALPAPAPVSSEGRLVLTVPVPDSAGLRGVELFFQALVVPPSGTVYLTRLCNVMIR